MKDLAWVGSSKKDLESMSREIQEDITFALTELQNGRVPGQANKDFKPMNEVGKGTYEIRVSDDQVKARCFYVAKYKNVIVVLHCFIKKTQKTSKADMDLGKARYKAAERAFNE